MKKPPAKSRKANAKPRTKAVPKFADGMGVQESARYLGGEAGRNFVDPARIVAGGSLQARNVLDPGNVTGRGVRGALDPAGIFGGGSRRPNWKKLDDRAAVQQIQGYGQMNPQERAAAVAGMQQQAREAGAYNPKTTTQSLQRTDAAGNVGRTAPPMVAPQGGGNPFRNLMQQVYANRQQPQAPAQPAGQPMSAAAMQAYNNTPDRIARINQLVAQGAAGPVQPVAAPVTNTRAQPVVNRPFANGGPTGYANGGQVRNGMPKANGKYR